MASKKKTTKSTSSKKSPARKKTTAKKSAAKKTSARKSAVKGAATKRRKAAARPAKKPKVAEPRPTPKENPKAHALARRIARLVLDKKANDVVILDVRGIASYADYVVLGSGESDRQVTAMAENVITSLKREEAQQPVGFEGFETGQWVLIDYGDVVAHLFFQDVRPHYDLEGLWADAPRENVA